MAQDRLRCVKNTKRIVDVLAAALVGTVASIPVAAHAAEPPAPQPKPIVSSLTGSLGASAAFDGAFRQTWSRSWLDEQAEETEYKMALKPGDALSFGR